MSGGSVADVVRSALPDAAGALLNGQGAARGCCALIWFVRGRSAAGGGVA
jgi:hypothetical protein